MREASRPGRPCSRGASPSETHGVPDPSTPPPRAPSPRTLLRQCAGWWAHGFAPRTSGYLATPPDHWQRREEEERGSTPPSDDDMPLKLRVRDERHEVLLRNLLSFDMLRDQSFCTRGHCWKTCQKTKPTTLRRRRWSWPPQKQQQKCLRQNLGNSVEQPCFEGHTGKNIRPIVHKKFFTCSSKKKIRGPVTAVLDRNFGKPVLNSVHDYDDPLPKKCRPPKRCVLPPCFPLPTIFLLQSGTSPMPRPCTVAVFPLSRPHSVQPSTPTFDQFRGTPAHSTKWYTSVWSYGTVRVHFAQSSAQHSDLPRHRLICTLNNPVALHAWPNDISSTADSPKQPTSSTIDRSAGFWSPFYDDVFVVSVLMSFIT